MVPGPPVDSPRPNGTGVPPLSILRHTATQLSVTATVAKQNTNKLGESRPSSGDPACHSKPPAQHTVRRNRPLWPQDLSQASVNSTRMLWWHRSRNPTRRAALSMTQRSTRDHRLPPDRGSEVLCRAASRKTLTSRHPAYMREGVAVAKLTAAAVVAETLPRRPDPRPQQIEADRT